MRAARARRSEGRAGISRHARVASLALRDDELRFSLALPGKVDGWLTADHPIYRTRRTFDGLRCDAVAPNSRRYHLEKTLGEEKPNNVEISASERRRSAI